MLFLDLEVYSDVSITDVPIDVYANHPSTRIILACAAVDDGPVQSFEGETIREFFGLFVDNRHRNAWNVGFERTVLNACPGYRTELRDWTDTMVLARRVGLPGSLKQCCKVPMLHMPAEEATRSETLLIKKFCMPHTGKPGTPEEWAAFVEYCRRDVLSLRHIYKYITSTFGPEDTKERKIWMLDQAINERGLPMDVPTIRFADAETLRLSEAARIRLASITGLDNPNSVQQLHGWLQARGYQHDSLGREFIQQALERDRDIMTPLAIEVLELRLSAAKSSVKKFAAMLQDTSPDGRARNRYVYYGAHTGRWSGRGFQPQNMNRTAHKEKVLQALIEGGMAA